VTAVRVTYYAPVEITVDTETGEIFDIMVPVNQVRLMYGEPVCYAGTNTRVRVKEAIAAKNHLSPERVRNTCGWRVVCE
jgi:hypothetical protein